jgi:hypothetical protein
MADVLHGFSGTACGDIFCTWANLGRTLRPERTGTSQFTWPAEHIDALVRVYHAWDNEQKRIGLELLERSAALLHPFGEPLSLEFGLNRWLRGEREEAYSDWMEWLFKKLSTNEIIELLCVDPNHEVARRIEKLPNPSKVRREVPVRKGHEGASGRLDLVIEFEKQAVVVIEVKVVDAQSADTGKQKGYIESLQELNPHSYPILLVVDQLDKDTQPKKVDGFQVLSYRKLCLGLRNFVFKNKRDPRGYVFLSFVLALAATIESNLIGMSAESGRINHFTQAYLKDFIEEGGNV